MPNETHLDIAKELWNRRYEDNLPMPREVTLAGFCQWVGCKTENITSVEDLEKLDLPVKMGGGFVRFPGHELQDVHTTWTAKANQQNLKRGEHFFGTGRNFFESLLTSLMTVYEMITCRKMQGTLKK